MKFVFLTFLFASTIAYPAWSSTQSSLPGPRTLTLDVFLDERAIGLQRFDLEPAPIGLRIISAVDFEMRILGFKAFGHNHRNQEEWRGGCLDKIQSTTDSNGRRYRVEGSALNGTFPVDATGVATQIRDCVGPSRIGINRNCFPERSCSIHKRGKHMAVKVTRQGAGVLRIDERDLAVERYVITGKGIDIALPYALVDGDWLGRDSRVEN